MMKCRKNNKADMDFAIAAVKQSRISAPGHVKRREFEYKLMMT